MRRNFDGTTADRGAGVRRFENRETWGPLFHSLPTKARVTAECRRLTAPLFHIPFPKNLWHN